jgi:hypothetical protein
LPSPPATRRNLVCSATAARIDVARLTIFANPSQIRFNPDT